MLTTVPADAARSGDFSEFVEPGRNTIFDPATGSPTTGVGRIPFAGNRIPTARISAQASSLLSFIPRLNTVDRSGVAFRRNFSTVGGEKFDADQFNQRSDWFINDKSSVFGRYSFAEFERAAPGAFGEIAGGPALDNVNFAGVSKVRNQSLALGYTRSWTPILLSEFRFGYMRYRVNVLPDGLGTIQCNCPLDQKEQQFQWVGNTTWIKGNHTIKFGGDVRLARNLQVPSDAHRSGEPSFSPQFTGNVAAVGAGAQQGIGLATFLLGETTGFRRFVSPNTDAAERQKRFFWYGQDTWRASDKLTLSYGLRWEQIFPETVNRPGNGGQLDLRTGEIAVFGVGDVSDHGLQDMKWTNFAPRFGVTYRLTEKTVVRAGYGWSYAMGTFGSIFGHNVTQNFPVLAIQALNRPNDFSGVFSLNQGPSQPTFPQADARDDSPSRTA